MQQLPWLGSPFLCSSWGSQGVDQHGHRHAELGGPSLNCCGVGVHAPPGPSLLHPHPHPLLHPFVVPVPQGSPIPPETPTAVQPGAAPSLPLPRSSPHRPPGQPPPAPGRASVSPRRRGAGRRGRAGGSREEAGKDGREGAAVPSPGGGGERGGCALLPAVPSRTEPSSPAPPAPSCCRGECRGRRGGGRRRARAPPARRRSPCAPSRFPPPLGGAGRCGARAGRRACPTPATWTAPTTS